MVNKHDPHLNKLLEGIGETFAGARHESAEKEKTVAYATKISEPVISKIEHGQYLPLSLKKLCTLAKHYKLEIEIKFSRKK